MKHGKLDLQGNVQSAEAKLSLDFSTQVLKRNLIQESFDRKAHDLSGDENMGDCWVDTFNDATGIDSGNSSDYTHRTSPNYDVIKVSGVEIDYMEYATDGAAQTAYVSSDGSPTNIVSEEYTGTKNYEYKVYGASGGDEAAMMRFKLSENITCTKVSVYLIRVGSPGDNTVCRIETAGGGLPTGTLVDANATKSITSSTIGTSYGWVDFEFSTSFSLSSNTDYCIVIKRSGARNTSNYIKMGGILGGSYADGQGGQANSGSWTVGGGTVDLFFKVYKIGSPNLQCYSESSIKNQGSYSLKAVAQQTDSLNDTLTKTLTGEDKIDLSGKNTLKFDVYASRTGTNLQMQIHDSGGTTSTKDIVISSANTWETTTWDISGIADANKDDIDSIIIKITNADATNTFYVDNFRVPSSINNMTLISDTFVAEAEPDTARIVLFEEDVDSITENTDLKAYVSKDGGSTYAEVTLSDEGDYETGKRILTGLADLTASGIGSGTNMEYKITSLNNKDLNLHGVGLHWD